jgi:DnaJ-domain-containing protein 1
MLPSLTIDQNQLDPVYFSLQKKIHPDKISMLPVDQKKWASSFSFLLNEAYKALKNKVLSAKSALLYFQDTKKTLKDFDDTLLPTPDFSFLSKIMEFQNERKIETLQIREAVLSLIEQAIVIKDTDQIAENLSKLIYLDRLSLKTQER